MVFRLFLAAILVAGIASAQGKKGGGGSKGGDMGGGMMRPQRVSRFDTISEKLKLNKEQKEQAATIFNAAQESAQPLNDQIAKDRNQITGAVIQGQATGDGYNAVIADYTGALTKMTSIEATAYGKLYAILKPNQQAKSAQVFADQMQGLFAGRDYKRLR